MKAKLTAQVETTMQSTDLSDPVAAQYLPDTREALRLPEELVDPIGDHRHSPVKGIVHRYPDRALLKITDSCAVNCRFCFRKEMLASAQGMLTPAELDAALGYIRQAPKIREIILTGGDPLTLSARRLKPVLSQLEDIPHLDILRIHTRSPVVQPDSMDNDMMSLFKSLKKPIYMVIHINHAQEIDARVKACFAALHQAGVILLSQSVLLKGINDSADTLETLFRTLIANRVRPYYLHHPDLVPGTSHFRLSIKQGQDIMRALHSRLSGLAQPTYVLDIPGGHGKMPIGPCYIEALAGGLYDVTNHQGYKHRYSS